MKKTKYGNVKLVNAFGKFDSKREYERFLFLMQLEREGKISSLQRQVKYELLPPIYSEEVVVGVRKTKVKKTLQQHATTYTADFVYVENGELVVEDVKISPKMLPPEYVLKKKMLYYFHGIKIREYYG